MIQINKFFVLFTIAVLIGCNSSDNKKSTPGSEQASEETLTSSRPDTIKAEISLEGTTETMPMYLLKSPASSPLDFTTYVPSDMETETVNSDEGNTIRIMAAFGGRLNKDVHLTIVAFPSGTTAEKAHARAEETAQSLDTTSRKDARYNWAEMVYSIEGERIGFLALAQKNDRWFYLLAAYPPQYGDGMGPRVNKIIEQWRWEDGSRLE